MSDYAFATLATDKGDQASVVVDGHHYRLDRLLPSLPQDGLRRLIDDWSKLLDSVEAVLPELSTLAEATSALVADPKLLAPVRYPAKMVCVGAVYRDHLLQFDLPAERWERMPLFLRPPTTSIVGPGPTIQKPRNTEQFDWEIELAVVVGAYLREASEAEARAAIAGYSVGIDMGARDQLNRYGPAGPDLVRCKAQDGFAPLGPTLVPARFVGDLSNLSLKLWVNGQVRQDSTTANMLYTVEEMLAEISRFITLEPGDVIFTGSPAGSALGDDDYLKPGDKIRASIERVGVLDVEVVAPASKAVQPAREPA